ncbi:MAG TPA: tetratricopeptide repeat protein [Planctomycetes bacterium]|nr:tetratricopeptide repeat protein [Planctomycetota bacterium]HIL51429.1 tetratricopeptide repeat protein [Planctomycetota bacterium]
MHQTPRHRVAQIGLLSLFLAVLAASCGFEEPGGTFLSSDTKGPAAVTPTAPVLALALPEPTTTAPEAPERDDTQAGALQSSEAAPLDSLATVMRRTSEQDLLLRSARNAVSMGNTDEARELFDVYLMQLPGDGDVRVEYAGLLVQAGSLVEAREMYEKCLERSPTATSVRHSLVDVLIMGAEFAAAATHLERIVQQDPGDLEAAAMLCRTYTWVKNLERAKAVFDRHLRKLDPSKEADQRLLAPVLLDIQKPGEALPHLERLRSRYPAELRWASSLALCYELLGDGVRATRSVDSMGSLERDVIDTRIRLVDQLLALKNYKLAMQVNQQVLDVAKSNPMARLMSARIHLESYDVRRATEVLDSLQASLSGVRRYGLVSAELHQLTGEWTAAQSIYQAMLMKQPDDEAVRINLALLYREKGELYKAKAELLKVPSTSPLATRAQLELAATLVALGDANSAVGICARVADSYPHDAEPIISMARVHLEMGHWSQAEAVCRRFIDAHPSNAMATGQVRVMLAQAQLASGSAVQAASTFQLALEEPTVRTPEAFYGLAVARSLGIAAASGEMALLSSTVMTSGEGIRMRVELGKHALGDQDSRRAISYLSNVLRWQPGNTAALVLLGEAQNMAFKSGVRVDPARTFAKVLARNPGNTRALLGLARAQASKREFGQAIATYESILAQDTRYTAVAREHARALFWDHRYADSFEAYDRLLVEMPDQSVGVGFFDGDIAGQGQRIALDFESYLEFSEAVRLEREAKINMGWRPVLAAKALQQLLILEPGNQEALFDLAQIEHRRGRTERSEVLYKKLIKESAGHQEAKVALTGAKRDLQPRMDIDSGGEERTGRDGLASMDERWFLTDITVPLGDRDDYAGIGIGQRNYNFDNKNPAALNQPGVSTTLTANVLRLFGSKRVGSDTVIDIVTELPSYDVDNFLSQRVFVNAGLRHVSTSQLTLDLRLFNEPVVENFLTLQRDISRMGGRLGLTKKSSRAVDYGGSLLIANYSDDNTRIEANLFGAYELSPAPRELRALFKADFLNNSEESNGLTGSGNQFPDEAIPYFSPKAYSVYSAELDWKHQFGDDWFTGSKDMYYQSSLRLAIDSNSVGYYELGLSAGYEINEWLRLQAGFSLLSSSAIDITRASALITLRWP